MDFKNMDFNNLSPEELERLNGYLDECSGNCSNCNSDCNQVTPKISKYSAALLSGKGGTGRSVITALLAEALRRRGLTVGVIDADIANPSMPYLLGVSGVMPNNGERVTPIISPSGIKLVSMGLLGVENDEPCLLGGKETANIASFFWAGADWETPDCVLVDMPSGIGDIPLEVFTVLPIDEIIIVSNPGSFCARMIRKMVSLVKMLLLPIRGVVENMSSGEGDSLALLNDDQLRLIAKIPYDVDLAVAADEGLLSDIRLEPIEQLADSMAADIAKL